MTETEFTKLSSKGQVVIPQEIREELHLKEGTPFAVIAQKDSILLKKIEIPKTKSWDEVTKPFRSIGENFNESDLERLIREVRK